MRENYKQKKVDTLTIVNLSIIACLNVDGENVEIRCNPNVHCSEPFASTDLGILTKLICYIFPPS
jgi:hypothetical protein